MKIPLTIPLGKLIGTVASSLSGKQFYKFQGIPYATPPLGDLRFKAPLPPKEWSGVLDATKEGNCCYSRTAFGKDRLVGKEDCLFLNVYTKKVIEFFTVNLAKDV